MKGSLLEQLNALRPEIEKGLLSPEKAEDILDKAIELAVAKAARRHSLSKDIEEQIIKDAKSTYRANRQL